MNLFEADYFLLALSGFLIASFSVVFGGGFFFSVPLFQLLFPQLNFGAIVGNLKFGAMFRGIASTYSTRREIDWRNCLTVSAPMMLGTIAGVTVIARLSQVWLIPALLTAIALAEYAERISSYITSKRYFFSTLIAGAYTGFFGAGSSIMILALLRLREPKDTEIAHLKIQTRVIELLLHIIAVVAHFLHGNLIFEILLWWSIGSFAGGYLGGHLLRRLGKQSGRFQLNILRTAYSFALLVALSRVLG